RSSFNENSGTLVTREEKDMEQVSVSGVTYDKNQARITIIGVPDKPGIAYKIFGTVANNNIVVDMIIQNTGQGGLTDISFTVPETDMGKAVKIVKEMIAGIGAKGLEVKDEVSKVSIIGVGMRSHSGVAAKMFGTLAKEGINIMMISTSEIKISCIIDSRYTELAVRALHDAFELGR
ncbi:MAG: ACT domain-containing protein, partial [Nitrospirota bacterium]